VKRSLGLLLPPAVWLVLFLVVPTAILAASAFSAEGLSFLAAADTLRLLGRSIRIAAAATVLCLLAGYPVAYFIAGCAPRWRNLLLFLVVLPFWTNLLVRTYGLMFVLRKADLPLYTEPAVVFGLFHSYLPFMVLPLYTSIEKLPRRLLEASQDLGASPWRTFLRVTVPLTMPGIAAGSILVFIPVLGAFALPELMGGTSVPMIGGQIDLHFSQQNRAAGSALTLVLMLFTTALTWLYYRFRRTEGLV
jgi:spermidine/putrescine transport system permease protein